MKILDTLSELAGEYADLRKIIKDINKDKDLSEKQRVFQIIKSVLVESFQDVELQSADMENGDDPEIYFIFIEGQLTATADLIELDGIRMLALNFHVQTLANKAIRIYNLLNRYLTVTIVSHSVFFPVDNKTSTRLVYNTTAHQKYLERLYKDMSNKITEIKDAAKESQYSEEIH